MPGFVGARETPGRYGKEHRAARKQWLALLAEAGSLPCYRCRRPLTVDMSIHLDHNDDGETYAGWSHARCNTRAGASLGGRRAAAAKAVRQGRTSALRW